MICSTTGAAIGSEATTGATGSTGEGSTCASTTFFTAFFRIAAGFLAAFVALGAAFSVSTGSFSVVFAALTARGFRGAASVAAAALRRTVFLGVFSSGSSDGLSVDSVITKFYKLQGSDSGTIQCLLCQEVAPQGPATKIRGNVLPLTLSASEPLDFRPLIVTRHAG